MTENNGAKLRPQELLTRKEKLSLIGLGYVGLPIAVAFARKVDVIGYDMNAAKIDAYRRGEDPTCEVGGQAVAQSGVTFTSDPAGLRQARFHIVAVPTPVGEDNTPDLSALVGASRTLGENLQPGSIIVYESTVFPGATEDICVPMLEEASGLRCGVDFFVGYSPERINPGDKEHRLENIVKIVSAMDDDTLEAISAVYEMVVEAGVYRASSVRVAEAAKVIENSQRDINIAFMNELSIIFHKMGIDTLEVLAAAGTKWNFLPFYPGLVGGHCIGVDPYYLTYAAEKQGYHSQIILAGRHINDDMGRYVAQECVKMLNRNGVCPTHARIGVLGFTFKENCPDIRNTRVIDIIEELRDYGAQPMVYDPIAEAAELKAFYGIDMADLADFRSLDALIVAVGHNAFRSLNMAAMLEEKGVLVDVKGITESVEGHDYWRL